MINTSSKDPNITEAAAQAKQLIDDVLSRLPVARTFDYGGHILDIGAYDMCRSCTVPIAEAQAAENALKTLLSRIQDDTIREHVELAARLFHVEAQAAEIRAELHNGHGTEPILNSLLGFQYNRHIGDEYHHSHHGGL